MIDKETGGTAFPMQDPQTIHAVAMAAVVGIDSTDERDRLYLLARANAVGGMTLRDYFAAKCMHGLNKSMVDYGWEDDVLMGYAKQAYRIADAMMEARK